MKVAVTTLAFCVAALLALGLVMLYSAKMASALGAYSLLMQFTWCALGFVVCVVMTFLDYQWLKKMAWPIFIGAIFLASLVFVPHLGKYKYGAYRWVQLPGIGFQPSEFVKVALIIMLAWYCDRSQRKMDTFKRGVVFPSIIIVAGMGLVFIEPDRGTTILMCAVGGMMLLIAGVRLQHLLISGVAGAAALAASILRDPMRMNRIAAWLHPKEHLQDAAQQAHQGMIAIGSGGLAGRGLGSGLQKMGYVAFIESDFIFANIGEELGLIATLFVLLAFLLIGVCGIYIALNARDQFGRLLAAGIAFLISLQAALNIAVVTSVLPSKGIALPFISAGGSNMLAMLTCIGILFSIARHAPVREKVAKAVGETGDNPFAAKAT